MVGDPPEKIRPVRRDSVSSMESTDHILHEPLVTPSLFDQSILNWPNLQEWAQKMWAKQYQHNATSNSTQSVQQVFTTDHRALINAVDLQDISLESSMATSRAPLQQQQQAEVAATQSMQQKGG